MEISERQAAAVLVGAAVTHRPEALRVLHAGFAGEPRRAGGGSSRVGKVLYDEARVRDLTTWPGCVAWPPLDPLEPGILVLRHGPRRPDPASPVGWRGVDLTAPPAEQRAAVARTRKFGFGSWAVMQLAERAERRVPVVVTVSGFVAFGAEIASLRQPEGAACCTLDLVAPGSWFSPYERTRLCTSAGCQRLWVARPA